ncbi:hypothetical protein DKP76_17445 [Falsochrobactrum shanghaiense]|uniref:Putative 4-hydroxy-4-methyl-2-oxoglutarate aldolase n=1 Tax=Falsochrobactrum shanghaiense TaxID=2201899 RepID=A0A316J6Q8_9HYPH|nr:hypothetical protein [Falsochrobactrum shanghaiense]PWL16449.1 hypothetical protein DKP76_17445 [Falsochrobactrum shanghaiense]
MAPATSYAVPEGVLARLASFSTATIYEAAGRIGALPASIRPLDHRMRLCGPAFPVHCPAGDNLALHRAIAAACPGEILLVDHEGTLDDGPFGDIMAHACRARGLSGLVISGCVRDSADLIRMDFPVFSLGISIQGTSKLVQGCVGEPVRIGDVDISRGDIIAGDADGVVIIANAQCAAVCEAAAKREEDETIMRNAIADGALTLDLLHLR